MKDNRITKAELKQDPSGILHRVLALGEIIQVMGEDGKPIWTISPDDEGRDPPDFNPWDLIPADDVLSGNLITR